MKKYYRVTIEEKGARPFFLAVTSESDRVIVGTEINRECEEVIPNGLSPDGERYTSRTRIIEKSAAKFVEFEMSNHYGWLVKKGKKDGK